VEVILAPGALADLEEIGDFIAEDNQDAASAFVSRLRSRCFEPGAMLKTCGLQVTHMM
jgi:plasmid stabilization system protein ParE